MEGFYSIAESVASSAQPKLDGGLFTYFLDQYSNISTIHTNSTQPPPPFASHFISTVNSGGFIAGIFFCLIWCIGLITGFCYLLWLRNKKATEPSVLQNNLEANKIHRLMLRSPFKSKVFLCRQRLQSKWIYLAFQCVGMTMLVCFLFMACILGFVTSHYLHNNLSTSSDKTNRHGFFPGISNALESTRLYMKEFLNETRTATEPALEQLIKATIEMQNETTYDFNANLFSMLKIDRAFELGDELGEHTVNLLNLVAPLKKHYNDYTDTISSLSMATARWNGFMEQLDVERNYVLPSVCQSDGACEAPVLARADISVSSHSRLPHFDFAIALNFVTDAQNRTPEAIEEQLKSSRILASEQLGRTIERMRTELDIPGTLRNVSEQNWQNIALRLTDTLKTIDHLEEVIPMKLSPMVSVASKYLLALGWALWLLTGSIALAVAWLIYQYHYVPAAIPSAKRQRIRCAASIGLFLLTFTVVISCTLFLVAGYIHTELCRYISPLNAVSVSNGDGQRAFVLDVHVNAFLDKNWEEVVRLAEAMDQTSANEAIPIPRIRSPVRALSIGCKANDGILEAFEAVDTFNFSVLNKPEMTHGFVEKGRLIMRDALLMLNATEMFPPALIESVQLADRLDDFLIPFNEVRRQLPRDFFNVTTFANQTILMPGSELSRLWLSYYAFLKDGGLATEKLVRADVLASNVFNLSSEISTILKSVDESLQQLEKIQKIGPTVNELQQILDNLMDELRNRETLIGRAMQLYDTGVAGHLPQMAERLVHKHGPPLIREVGRCRRLFDAYSAGVSGVCSSVVGPLNGLWLFAGFCTMISVVLVALSMCLLLHKITPFPHDESSDGEPLFGSHCYSRIARFPLYPKASSQPLPSINGVRLNFSPGAHRLLHTRAASLPQSPTPL